MPFGRSTPDAPAETTTVGWRSVVLPAQPPGGPGRDGAQRLVHGAVHPRPAPGGAGPQRRRQPAERGRLPGEAQSGDPGELHGLGLLGVGLGQHRPAGRLADQVGPAVAGVRAVGPEPADGHDNQRRHLRAQVPHIDAPRRQVPPAEALDDDVGPAEQGEQVVTGLEHHAALVGVEVHERARPLAQPAARRWLHLDHLGAEVGEGLAAEGAGRLLGDLDDQQVVQ